MARALTATALAAGCLAAAWAARPAQGHPFLKLRERIAARAPRPRRAHASHAACANDAPARLRIVVGNKAYSSWSLRAWLALRVAAGPENFDEVVVKLAGAGSAAQREELLKFSPTGKVPALVVDRSEGSSPSAFTIWDSLAICEYVAERYPGARLWPSDSAARALARSAASEMHSGFARLRDALPMNVRRDVPDFSGLQEPGVAGDIDRVCELWATCLAFPCDSRGEGPFLFGHFTVADAMFAPVVLRFASYHPKLPEHAQRYCSAILAMPEVAEWVAAANEEEWRIDQYENRR